MAKPSYQDATLILQIAQWASSEGIIAATNWMWSDEFIPDYSEFIKKYQRGSEEYNKASKICACMETIGTLYKHNLINEELLFDWLAISLTWEGIKGFALGIRDGLGEPRLYENFEAIVKAQKG